MISLKKKFIEENFIFKIRYFMQKKKLYSEKFSTNNSFFEMFQTYNDKTTQLIVQLFNRRT